LACFLACWLSCLLACLLVCWGVVCSSRTNDFKSLPGG
jgi:hypothetical protein